MAIQFLGLFLLLSLHSFPPFESGLKVWYSFAFVIIYVHLISNYFSVLSIWIVTFASVIIYVHLIYNYFTVLFTFKELMKLKF